MHGMLGHYGPTLNNERNKLVIKAKEWFEQFKKK